MKKCDYCGRDNPEDVAYCEECGTAFSAQAEAQGSDQVSLFEFLNLNARISGFAKCVLCVAAGIVVLLVMGPNSIVFARFFPLGLLALFPRGAETAIKFIQLNKYGSVSWLVVYCPILLTIGVARKRWAFFLFYLLLCALLALNVVGCNRTLEAASDLH